MTQFQHWRDYCQKHQLKCWRATSDDVIGYLDTFRAREISSSTIQQHLSAIAYMYRLKRLPSPTMDPIVGMYVRGLKRNEVAQGKPRRQAKPITKDVLNTLIEYLYSGTRSLRIWRTVWRVNVAFYALLRWDDICRLRVSCPQKNVH